MTTAEQNGRPAESHGLVTVLKRSRRDVQLDWVVNIRSIIAMAHLIQDVHRPGRWLVNSRIDLWTYNEFY